MGNPSVISSFGVVSICLGATGATIFTSSGFLDLLLLLLLAAGICMPFSSATFASAGGKSAIPFLGLPRCGVLDLGILNTATGGGGGGGGGFPLFISASISMGSFCLATNPRLSFTDLLLTPFSFGIVDDVPPPGGGGGAPVVSNTGSISSSFSTLGM